MADFIRADIGKLEGFLKDSAAADLLIKKKRIISLRKLVE